MEVDATVGHIVIGLLFIVADAVMPHHAADEAASLMPFKIILSIIARIRWSFRSRENGDTLGTDSLSYNRNGPGQKNCVI